MALGPNDPVRDVITDDSSAREVIVINNEEGEIAEVGSVDSTMAVNSA